MNNVGVISEWIFNHSEITPTLFNGLLAGLIKIFLWNYSRVFPLESLRNSFRASFREFLIEFYRDSFIDCSRVSFRHFFRNSYSYSFKVSIQDSLMDFIRDPIIGLCQDWFRHSFTRFIWALLRRLLFQHSFISNRDFSPYSFRIFPQPEQEEIA